MLYINSRLRTLVTTSAMTISNVWEYNVVLMSFLSFVLFFQFTFLFGYAIDMYSTISSYKQANFTPSAVLQELPRELNLEFVQQLQSDFDLLEKFSPHV